MMAAISFTGILRDVFNGILNLDDVGMILVGCTEEHLPDPASDLLPCEVGWLRKPGDREAFYALGHLVAKWRTTPEGYDAYQRLWLKMHEVPTLRTCNNYWDTAKWLFDSGKADKVWLNRQMWTPDTLAAMGHSFDHVETCSVHPIFLDT